MLTSAAEGAPCSSNDRIQLAAILAVFLKQWQGEKSQYAGIEVGEFGWGWIKHTIRSVRQSRTSSR